MFEQIRSGGAKSSKMGGTLEIGVDSLPKLPRDAGDRNRTSPFAFTGNRFEFRAVGSSQSIADPLVAAEHRHRRVVRLHRDQARDRDRQRQEAERRDSRGPGARSSRSTARSIFDGNGYSAEWHAEAEKRGLPNYKTAVDALPVLEQKDVVALFDKYKVLSPRELHSRYEIQLEIYNKTVNVEANLTAKIAETTILPAAHALPAGAGRERHRGQGGGVHAGHARCSRR